MSVWTALWSDMRRLSARSSETVDRPGVREESFLDGTTSPDARGHSDLASVRGDAALSAVGKPPSSPDRPAAQRGTT